MSPEQAAHQPSPPQHLRPCRGDQAKDLEIRKVVLDYPVGLTAITGVLQEAEGAGGGSGQWGPGVGVTGAA